MGKKSLKFVCPECEATCLCQIQHVPWTYPIKEIDPDGDFEYDLDNAKDAGGDVETISHECIDCGFIISNDYGFPITDHKKVADWVKENCPQD